MGPVVAPILIVHPWLKSKDYHRQFCSQPRFLEDCGRSPNDGSYTATLTVGSQTVAIHNCYRVQNNAWLLLKYQVQCAADAARQRQAHATLSSEQLQAQLDANAARQRQAHATLSPEQLQVQLDAHTAWQPYLPTPFCSVVVSILSLWPFNCISSHKFSRQFSAFPLCSSGLISALLVLSTIYLFMKVSFSPDKILCGWLGLKHELTN